MGRSDSHVTDNNGLKKGPWTREEDQKLLSYIKEHGHGSWRSLPSKAGLERCGKSCRLRWTNYLRPDIKRGKFSTHEEKTIIRLHALLGNRWSAIASHLPKRTDNEIKNYWNTRLKKRLARMGIDPATHKPKNSSPTQSHHVATLSHMAQWEAARLEAEARASRPHLLRWFPTRPPPPLFQRNVAPPLPPPPSGCLDVLKVWQATTGTLDSPTSTLSFSNNIGAVSAVGSMLTNTLNDGFDLEGKIDNCSRLEIVNLDYDSVGAVDDLAALDRGPFGGDGVGEFEDVRNYWSDILNLESSPMELPGFLDL